MDNPENQSSVTNLNQQNNQIIPQNNFHVTKRILILIVILIVGVTGIGYIFLGQNKENGGSTITTLNTSSVASSIIIVSPTNIQITKVAMKGSSMNPNYLDNTYYPVDRNYFLSHIPQKGDVVLLVTQSANGPSEVIKRVIGLPGEKIQIKDGEVYINGIILSDSYVLKKGSTKLYTETIVKESQVIEIPQEQYFVMGDNREHSSDSRDWGFLKKENIIGKLE